MNQVKIKKLIEAARAKKPVEVNRIAQTIISEKVKALIAAFKKEVKVR